MSNLDVFVTDFERNNAELTLQATAGVSIQTLTPQTTSESGSTAQYAVVLETAPTSNVILTFKSSNIKEGVVTNSIMLFTPYTWDITQNLNVIGVNDYKSDGDIAYKVSVSIQSSDSNYQRISVAPLSLTNLDDGRDKAIVWYGDNSILSLAVDDVAVGLDGADKMYGQLGNDKMNGGWNNDSLYGGVGFDTLVGDEGNDELYGDDGDDSLEGGKGNDKMYGGVGINTLKGGEGSDTYYLGDLGLDIIDDQGSDKDSDTVVMSFQLKSYKLPVSIENGMMQSGLWGDLIGNEKNNKLTGNEGSNLLDGDAGRDTLYGSAGDDTIKGGNDIDSMVGGAGDDTYYVDNVRDRTIEDTITNDAITPRGATPGGTDVVISSVSHTLAPNIENVTLLDGSATTATGNQLDNFIVGNSNNNLLSGLDGDDTLNGEGGNDTLVGGTGNDELEGGSGSDVFRFNVSAASSNRDVITDFSVPSDTIQLENGIFTALTITGVLSSSAFNVGSSALDSSDRVIYNKTTGGIFYDADGTGSSAMLQIATVGVNLSINNLDFIII